MKILNVVGRYAVHCEGVAFTCKKVGFLLHMRQMIEWSDSTQHGDNDYGVSTVSNSSLVDRIRKVHGSAVANEVIDFETAHAALGFKAKGMITNANYSVKKTTLLLFINGIAVYS